MIILRFVSMAATAIGCFAAGLILIVFPHRLLGWLTRKGKSGQPALFIWILRIAGVFSVLLGLAVTVALVIALIITGILLK